MGTALKSVGEGWRRLRSGAGMTRGVLRHRVRLGFVAAVVALVLLPAGSAATPYGPCLPELLVCFIGSGPPGGADGGRAIVVQPDGKILLAGSGLNADSGQDFALVRLNPDFSEDNSFNPSSGGGQIRGGRQAIDFGDDDYATALALQPNGKIVVAGYTTSGLHPDDFAVARLNRNGSLDDTFGDDGKVTVDFGREDDAYAVAVQADGKIVVAGNTPNASGDEDFAVVSLEPDGARDPSFGTDGRVAVDFGGEDTAYAVALQRDGKIVLAGNSRQGSEVLFAVARLNANGSLDQTFGAGGKVARDFASTDGARAVLVQPNGKLLVAGNAYGGSDQDAAVWRLMPNGSGDPSFGPHPSGPAQGLTLVDFGGNDHAYGVALRPGGLVVVGSSTDTDTNVDSPAIAWLRPNGSSASVGETTSLTFDLGILGPNAVGYLRAVALLPSDNLAAVGYASSDDTSGFLLVPVPGFRFSPQLGSTEVFGHGKLRRLLVDLHAPKRGSATLQLLAFGVVRFQHTFSLKPGQNVLQARIPPGLQSNDYRLEITLVDAQGHRTVYDGTLFVPS